MSSSENTDILDENSVIERPQVFVMLADPILERVYRNRLQSVEYCLVWCEKGERWKESILAFPYDVLVVDFSLFTTDPIEGLVAIRKLSPESEIVVLTESHDVRTAIAAFRLGVNDYFLKPTDPEALAWAVEKILKRRSLKNEYRAVSRDYELFTVSNQITTSESDGQMRSLAMHYLIPLLGAEGGIWVWPPGAQPDPFSPAEGAPHGFQIQGFHASQEQCEKALIDFGKAFPKGLSGAFAMESEGGDAPLDHWVQNGFAWLPFRKAEMGGILLFGLTIAETAALKAQLDFLLRSLDVALENFRRYMSVKQLTYVDDLTGLYNSRYLEIAIHAAIDDYKRTRSGFSVLFIDIDKFKSVNDTHGHLVGSALLVELANHLKRSLRKPDHLFRYGGDEFIALLYEIDAKKAIEAAERLRAEIETKGFFIQGKEYRITLSIGVARFPEHGQDKAEILRMADEAMYNSKKTGRNRVFIAGTSPEAAAKTVKSTG